MDTNEIISPADAGGNGADGRAGDRGAAIGAALDPLGTYRVRDAEVRPLRSREELAAVTAAAAGDDHQVVGATHLVQTSAPEGTPGAIIGYGSLPLTAGTTIPLINVWLDSARPNPRRSWELLKLAEDLARQAGFKVICVPCTQRSPFRPYMEDFGYDYLGEAGYFLKRFAKPKG